jgi:hypothetical protein
MCAVWHATRVARAQRGARTAGRMPLTDQGPYCARARSSGTAGPAKSLQGARASGHWCSAPRCGPRRALRPVPGQL